MAALTTGLNDIKPPRPPAELYQFLYAMPKGGDLHLHLSGSVLSRWYYETGVSAVGQRLCLLRKAAHQ